MFSTRGFAAELLPASDPHDPSRTKPARKSGHCVLLGIGGTWETPDHRLYLTESVIGYSGWPGRWPRAAFNGAPLPMKVDSPSSRADSEALS